MDNKRNLIHNLFFAIGYILKIDPMYIFLTIFSAIFNSVYNLFNIVIIKLIVDAMQDKKAEVFYHYIIIVFLVGIVISAINAALSNVITPKMLNRIKNEIQKSIFKGYVKYDFSYANNRHFYDKYYYVLENGESAITSTVNCLGGLITDIITIIGISYLVFYYGYLIILLILGFVVISFIYSIKVEQKQYLFKEVTTILRRKLDYVRRIFYMPDYFKDLRVNDNKIFYDTIDDSCFKINLQINRWGYIISIFSFINNMCIILLNVITIFIFGIKVINGTITLGAFTMLYSGTQKLSSSLIKFFSTFQALYQNSLNIDEFRVFLENNNFKNYVGDVEEDVDKKIGGIRIRDVSYSYLDKKVISNLNIDIKKGTVNFIIGKNGTGKSTLVHLLAGLLTPQEGIIYCYDSNNEKINGKHTKYVSTAFQDFKIYNFSILQNVTMKNVADDSDKVRAYSILKSIKLDEKIGILEKGIYTELSGEFSKNGINFSIGELQRISLARAIFKNKDIIILDEFTSFSDTEIKFCILNYIRKIYKDKIVLIVTHDYSLIQEEDNVIFLQENGNYRVGRINELIEYKNQKGQNAF
jgi:ABC superfamily ATP binding cassette transporter, ABC protein